MQNFLDNEIFSSFYIQPSTILHNNIHPYKKFRLPNELDSRHGHKQLLTFYTTKFLRLHLTPVFLFRKLLLYTFTFTYITICTRENYLFVVVFICFQCKYMTIKSILQAKNSYTTIRKNYLQNNICISNLNTLL